MHYDTAIIGAGADGLAAATTLARAGRKVVVIERADQGGGRLQTRQFHPGFFASPFLDSVPEIPAAVRAMLAGVVLNSASAIPDAITRRHTAGVAHVLGGAAARQRQNFLGRLARRTASPAPSWPGGDLATAMLGDWDEGAVLQSSRVLDPALAGSAVALMTLPRHEAAHGGLGALGAVFIAAAVQAGVEFRVGLEASEVLTQRGHASGVMLADGSRVEAATVISTLDIKQSLLGLFPWNALPPAMIAQAGAFRLTGGAARLLLALDGTLTPENALTLPGDEHALASFRRGALPDNPPLRFDPVSARDPGLAPPGCSVATVSLGCIPHRLFDGGWTHAKRVALSARALARLSQRLPGLTKRLKAVDIIVPPDMEAALGVTNGDLDGGQLTPDQMLGLRPDIRTALPGFYLGGRSTGAGPLGTGLAGLAAATAVLADALPAGLERWLP